MVKLHDLDSAYEYIDSEDIPDPAYADQAHWLSMEYCGDNAYFIEATMSNGSGEAINFYMSRAVARRIKNYLDRMLHT